MTTAFWTILAVVSGLSLFIYWIISRDAAHFEKSKIQFLGREELYQNQSSQALTVCLIMYAIGLGITLVFTLLALYQFLNGFS